MRALEIDGVRIADDAPCYVIAELGHNHGGSVETACQMVQAAKYAGVHAVKLQKRDNERLYHPRLLAQPYENENSYGPTYGAHRAALEFGREQYQDVARLARWQGVACFATAFDEQSADDLMDWIDPPAFKIASGGLTDTPLLRYVASFRKPILLSTGGGTEADVDRAVQTITAIHTDLAVLHCTASYPCAFEELNLQCIQTFRLRYPDLVIGWSSHDNGIAMAVSAYTLGARILEKHFTLNRAMKGTDHAFSLEPDGMRKLCRDLSRAHVAMGDGVKRWYQSEVKPISKMRRTDTEDGWQITGSTGGLR